MGKSGLTNQIYLYSLETKDFYTDKESSINNRYIKAIRIKNKLKNKVNTYKEYINYYESLEELSTEDTSLHKRYSRGLDILVSRMDKLTDMVKSLKSELDFEISQYDPNTPRVLRDDAIKIVNKVGLFESTLTRVCGFKTDETSDNIFIINIYHYNILKSIIDNGFIYNETKYIYLTSSAGQIRTKKIVVINEELYRHHENTITCGLTVDKINEKGGVNTNKYQAYLALTNSASDVWKRFNIDRVIVVDDFSTIINAEVDYVDSVTFGVERKFMDMSIDHMDGCGIMLPTVSKKSFMIRKPWVKGLLTPFDFIKFIKEHNANPVIKDIYGKEWNVIEDNINIIMTKSQFKMWKFYDSWEHYKENFKKYGCEACKLNVEDIGAKASINYQMLQTLTTMTDDELQIIAQSTIDDITKIGTDKHTMLRVLGAFKENQNMNYYQKSLLFYPELLSDSHSKEVIRSKKNSLVRDAKAGKLSVNGYYTFIIPDVYAFCEWLFLGIENPNGLLANEEVYCNIFDEGELDVLRAPHLYKEHAIRNNVKSDKLNEWFITKGIYTSCKDLISRILQFDVDGDKSLVVQDKTLIEVAKRDMKGVVPLFYEMYKAKDKLITTDAIYEALTSAYKANIGIISNEITKIWNSAEPNEEAVKWLCMYNNFVIDYAKTLYLPKKPEHVEEELKKFTLNKLPHFFKYAKDKEEGQVEPANNTTVNKLNNLIPNKRIFYKNVSGTVDYSKLMYNSKVFVNSEVIEKFVELNKIKNFLIDENNYSENEEGFYTFLYNELKKIEDSDVVVADILVQHFFKRESRYKETLWKVYGKYIYENLERNLAGTVQCSNCTTRFKGKGKSTYCEPCGKKIKQIQTNESKRKKIKNDNSQ